MVVSASLVRFAVLLFSLNRQKNTQTMHCYCADNAPVGLNSKEEMYIFAVVYGAIWCCSSLHGSYFSPTLPRFSPRLGPVVHTHCFHRDHTSWRGLCIAWYAYDQLLYTQRNLSSSLFTKFLTKARAGLGHWLSVPCMATLETYASPSFIWLVLCTPRAMS